MKFVNDKPVEASSNSSTSGIVPDATVDPNNAKDSSSPSKATNPSVKRHHMFADELTLGSFFRRLSFTTDGAFLVVPAALWHGRKASKDDDAPLPGSPTSVASNGVDKLAESSFATYLFARHHFDQPYKVLTGLEKVSTNFVDDIYIKIVYSLQLTSMHGQLQFMFTLALRGGPSQPCPIPTPIKHY